MISFLKCWIITALAAIAQVAVAITVVFIGLFFLLGGPGLLVSSKYMDIVAFTSCVVSLLFMIGFATFLMTQEKMENKNQPKPEEIMSEEKVEEQHDMAIKETVRAVVSNGYQRFKEQEGSTLGTSAHSLIQHVTASVINMLMDKANKVEDAAALLKISQLEGDLKRTQLSKEKMSKAHKLLAIRLGIWGKPSSVIEEDAWYIWVDQKPAWDGYLAYGKWYDATAITTDGCQQSTTDTNKAASFVSEEAAQECINYFVHPHLRPYCKPTQGR